MNITRAIHGKLLTSLFKVLKQSDLWKWKMRIKEYRNLFWKMVYREGIINEKKKLIISESLKVVDLAEQGDTWEAINIALQNGRTFRTWKKHTEIIKACKQLYREGIINEKKKLIISESLKVVDLAEQVFDVNHAGTCVEYGHGGHWNSPDYNVNDVIYIDMKECYPAIVNRKLPQKDITRFAQTRILEDLTVEEAIISLTQQTKVWLPENQDVSCAIIDKLTQGDEGELDFLIKDCTDAETFTDRKKSSILAYAHINLLEMIRKFELNEIVFYKIEKVPAFFKQVETKSNSNLCLHIDYPSCAMCIDPGELLIYSKSEYVKWIKEFQKTKMSLVNYGCEKIYSPVINIVYWSKNRHWKSIKEILDSTTPLIHDLITKYRNSYLNGEGRSGKTTRAIRIFKDINMVILTHTNALAKDF
ncbi:hypothetical protein Glove_326g94 [Diversispora epigaea]|uniref:Uncharacterized protein n=1 Tax=Diversispora epigaea TaxID=1348612 RepID=A0A397HMN3_9GLOM|nr:hypothetical protein Glove_326g94 [Diversispora epigaea]